MVYKTFLNTTGNNAVRKVITIKGIKYTGVVVVVNHSKLFISLLHNGPVDTIKLVTSARDYVRLYNTKG